ncbi:MAG: prolyl oligopeptidase family serine peptidase, partial [Pseudomonadota bacterium]
VKSVEAVIEQARDILKPSGAATDMFLGHARLRWLSFMEVDTTALMRKSKAHVYLLGGVADKITPIASTEILFARLFLDGRDVTFHRVPDVGHSLMKPNEPVDNLTARVDAIFEWYWAHMQ